MEGRVVANNEIPGAFLKTDYGKGDIHNNMEGAIMTLLEEIYPAHYKDLIHIDICRKMACMQKPIRLYTAY